MTGWLVVNNFIDSSKFSELYAFLENSAKRHGIELSVKKTGELMSAYEKDMRLPDFVLFWDKDIILAKRLEMMGARVFNKASAIEICDNKALTAIKLKELNIPSPETYVAPKTFEGVGYNSKEFLSFAGGELGYPMIIKESFGSFGQQVYLANNFSEAEKIADKIGSKEFIMQEFISFSSGCDVRVNVVGGKVVSAMKRKSVTGDFRSNISNGGVTEKFKLTSNIEEIAIKTCKGLGLDFAGVDVLFLPDGKNMICEVNSNPHFKSSFDCTGIDVSDEIIKHIKTRCAD